MEVVVFGNIEKAREVAALFEIVIEEDHSWNIPALRVKGEAPVVRGYLAFLKALDDSISFVS